MARDHDIAAWLPKAARQWAQENRAALEAIYARFVETGKWPDPVQLQRELRAQSSQLDVLAAADEMPSLLGWRDYGPEPRVCLTLWGVSCCAASSELLDHLAETVQLALTRFDQPDLPNRLSRTDVVAALELSETEADRLSAIILLDGFFLNGGDAGLGTWDQAISEDVRYFAGAGSPEAVLSRLAGRRGIDRMPTSATTRISHQPGPFERLRARAWNWLRPHTWLERLERIILGLVVAVIVAWLGVSGGDGGSPSSTAPALDPADIKQTSGTAYVGGEPFHLGSAVVITDVFGLVIRFTEDEHATCSGAELYRNDQSFIDVLLTPDPSMASNLPVDRELQGDLDVDYTTFEPGRTDVQSYSSSNPRVFLTAKSVEHGGYWYGTVVARPVRFDGARFSLDAEFAARWCGE